MARKAATVEYLERLIAWAGGAPEFRKMTGIHAPNLSAYLAGTKRIGWKRLRSATHEVFGEPPAFVPVIEAYDFRANGINGTNLPATPGIYAFFDTSRRLVYYGKATSLYAEVRQTLGRESTAANQWTGAKNLLYREITTYISAYSIPRSDATFRHDVEALGLRLVLNNTFNRNSGRFKRLA